MGMLGLFCIRNVSLSMCINLQWQTAWPGQKVIWFIVCAYTHDTRWGISSSPWRRFDSICVHMLQCWCTNIHSPPHGCSCRCPLGSSYRTRSHPPGGPQGLVTHNTWVSKKSQIASQKHTNGNATHTQDNLFEPECVECSSFSNLYSHLVARFWNTNHLKVSISWFIADSVCVCVCVCISDAVCQPVGKTWPFYL